MEPSEKGLLLFENMVCLQPMSVCRMAALFAWKPWFWRTGDGCRYPALDGIRAMEGLGWGEKPWEGKEKERKEREGRGKGRKEREGRGKGRKGKERRGKGRKGKEGREKGKKERRKDRGEEEKKGRGTERGEGRKEEGQREGRGRKKGGGAEGRQGKEEGRKGRGEDGEEERKGREGKRKGRAERGRGEEGQKEGGGKGEGGRIREERHRKMEAYHILIVEDDKDIRDGIEIYLRNQGYVVSQAADGIEGLGKIEAEEIHLAIVDIMMPRMDGITMMMKVREKGYDFPVIMLSAKSEEVDKIMGLNMGADDYVTKPFTTMELLARVNSHLRRYGKYLQALDGAQDNGKAYVIGGLELNEETVEVSVDGKPVKMTPLEFKILMLLMKNPGRVFSAEEIYERVWNEQAVNTDTIMVHVRKIREKIEVNPKEPKYLKVVWGVGYKIEKQ